MLSTTWLKADQPHPMASTHKKVIIRKVDRDSLNGYVGSQFVVDGKLEVMNTAGQLVSIDLKDVKGVYFVRDFTDTDALTRKTFTSRPRTAGLWVRLRFRDNEIIEGMMPNDLTQITDGYLINPPDTGSNTQRIFVPRTAVSTITVVAVIGASQRRRREPAKTDERQAEMFGIE